MRRYSYLIYLSIIFIWLSPSFVFPQGRDINSEKYDDNKNTSIYFGIYYHYAQKEALRDYNTHVIPYTGSPLFLEAGMLFNMAKDIELRCGIGYRHYKLESPGTLINIPLSLTGRYYIFKKEDFGIYGGLGIAYYLSSFKTEMLTLLESGQIAGKRTVTQTNSGVGVLGEAGITCRIGKSSGFDAGLSYDLTTFGKPANNGLGDLGGLQINFRIFFDI